MRVAIVYDHFPHYRAAVMRELLENSDHEYLLVGDDQQLDSTLKHWVPEDQDRFRVARCRKLPIPKLWFQKGLVKLALRDDLDCIIYWGNPYYVCTWLSALLARLSGKRVLFWTHGWTRRERGPKAFIRDLFHKLPHGFLLYGHVAKALGISRGFSAGNLYVIYNSLDYESQKAAREKAFEESARDMRRRFFSHPDRPMVICSARLIPECDFSLLIRAQAELERQGHRFNLLLVGDGPERKRLETLAGVFGVPVKFYGACYDELTLARLTTAASVTVSPGKVGLTAMQSFAFGTPVITHGDFERQGPEWEAIVPGKTGDFFKRGDVADLARVIKIWTSTEMPRSETRKVCYEMLERFYNPAFQRVVIDRAVSGNPADDLFWLKEPNAVNGASDAAPRELCVQQTFA